MWQEVRGQTIRYAGASGTVTVSPGGHVLSIRAHATSVASINMWNGDQQGGVITIPVPAGTYFVYDPKHLNMTAQNTARDTEIIFASTDQFLVEVSYPNGQ